MRLYGSHPTPHNPHLTLHSLSGMRPPLHDWLGIVSIVGARRSLRPDVLAIYDCNLKPEVLPLYPHPYTPKPLNPYTPKPLNP
jgi:hypothetical protein